MVLNVFLVTRIFSGSKLLHKKISFLILFQCERPFTRFIDKVSSVNSFAPMGSLSLFCTGMTEKDADNITQGLAEATFLRVISVSNSKVSIVVDYLVTDCNLDIFPHNISSNWLFYLK